MADGWTDRLGGGLPRMLQMVPDLNMSAKGRTAMKICAPEAKLPKESFAALQKVLAAQKRLV